MLDREPAVLDLLRPAYRPLFARVVAAVTADDRVRALWLAGSLATGTADAGSDLDLIVTVADDAFDDFAARWREWLAGITPTVVARELPAARGSFHSVTATCERLDVVAERVSEVPTTTKRRAAVFDRDGLREAVPPAAPAPGPDRQRIAWLIEEFLRQQVIFPVVVIRDDWLMGVVGVHQAHLQLYELFVAANAPWPPSGVKRWSTKLTPEQRTLLASLPVPQPARESVLAARTAVARAFLGAGRAAAASAGVAWPDELARAADAHLHRELGHGLTG